MQKFIPRSIPTIRQLREHRMLRKATRHSENYVDLKRAGNALLCPCCQLFLGRLDHLQIPRRQKFMKDAARIEETAKAGCSICNALFSWIYSLGCLSIETTGTSSKRCVVL